jgi:hypothetical protein
MRTQWLKPVLPAFVLCLCAWAALPQANPSNTQTPAANAATPAKPSATSGEISSADIAAAKASHNVWVNLDTGVYHKGGRWYGKTKNGKFMTEDDAKKAGYKPAKRD